MVKGLEIFNENKIASQECDKWEKKIEEYEKLIKLGYIICVINVPGIG